MLSRLSRATKARPPGRDTRGLTADLLRKVRRIEISTNRLVDQGIAGDYHSVFKGRGMEFAEVRPYQPGDDVRTVDWNVTARMGTPFIKEFVEERDLSVFLVVDVSGSLGFGSRALLKRELAAELATLLAFAALRNQDRVGAALVSDRLELLLRPQRRRNHVLRLAREILTFEGGGGTDLERGLRAVLRILKQRSVLFVISDFLTPIDRGRAFKAAAARHDLILLEIQDPRDEALPTVGVVPLRDAETGRVALISGRAAAERHAAEAAERRARLRGLSRGLGVDHLVLPTDHAYLPTLVNFFERRRRRLSR
jgi:uncharacterized protein (DUF58 family)